MTSGSATPPVPRSSPDPTDRRAVREAERRRKARRGAGISVAASVALFGGLAALVLTSTGWPTFRDAFLSLASASAVTAYAAIQARASSMISGLPSQAKENWQAFKRLAPL